ncbi:MAG: hypothetical protein ACN6I4_00415 [bacterium]
MKGLEPFFHGINLYANTQNRSSFYRTGVAKATLWRISESNR